MEAKELRIGNYVRYQKSVVKFGGQITQIHEIVFDTIDSFDPIPLTEEWLLKFGLTENTFSHNFENETRLSIYKVDDCFMIQIDDVTIKQIKYVHEFQNIHFDFTNEELTLKTN